MMNHLTYNGKMARHYKASKLHLERQQAISSDSDDGIIRHVSPKTRMFVGINRNPLRSSDDDMSTTETVCNNSQDEVFYEDQLNSDLDIILYEDKHQHYGSNRNLKKDYSLSCASIVDGLLCEIYDRWQYQQRDSLDSDTFTEYSSTSDAFFGRSDSCRFSGSYNNIIEQRHSTRLNRALLEGKDINELEKMIYELKHRTNMASACLIRQLKRKDGRMAKLQKNFDIVTAFLQASSLKRRIDTRIRFSIEPLAGDDCFKQWRDAMKAVARLPQGIPDEFRRKVWLALADHSLRKMKLDWEKTKRFAFNERSNPDDNKLGVQIVKDLHRTGCSGFSGQDNEEERAILKRVLLGYARWNKRIGYCQGFNVLAALILDVFQNKEDDALKIMIFLIDHVLPESYFANNLRALSVDMAVFRDLLRLTYPQLSNHLDHLQSFAKDHTTGANYEPPLTNVFTMQWFLTVFATCLPKETALRVWDAVMLEGSEMMLRTATAIWGELQDRILQVQSADEFYTVMGTLTREMLDTQIVGVDNLMKSVYTNQELNFPQLAELREKYTYNITPFTAAMATGQRPTKKGAMNIFSDEDEFDEEDIEPNIGCFTGILPHQNSPNKNQKLSEIDKAHSASAYDISKATPGAYAAHSEALGDQWAIANMERMTTDIGMLQKQYSKLRQRQKQAHVIMEAAAIAHHKSKPKISPAVAPIETPAAVNHLFIGHHGKYRRNRCVAMAPCIAPMFNGPSLNSITTTEIVTKKVKSPKISNHLSIEESPTEPLALDGINYVESCDYNNNSKVVRTVSGSSLYSDTETPSLHAADETENPPSSNSISHIVSQIDLTDNISHDIKHNISQNEVFSSSEIKETDSLQIDNENDACIKPDVDERKPVKDSFNETCDSPVAEFLLKPTLLQLSKNADDCDLNEKIQLNNYISIKKDVSKSKGHKQSNQLTEKCKRNSLGSVSNTLCENRKYSSTSCLNSEYHNKNQKKAFNPFPSQHINKNRTKNGMRLGLYAAPESNPSVRSTTMNNSTSSIDSITRSHINQCLNRQYLSNSQKLVKQ